MASIGKIVQEIKKDSSRKGTIHGIVFSLSYCSVVRLHIDAGGSLTFRHTPALPFLSSSHATDRSTPGMTALVRLMAHRSSHSIVQDALQVMNTSFFTRFNDPLPSEVSQTIFSKLPAEVCGEIVKYLQIREILILSRLSDSCHEAAAYVLRYPHIEIGGSYYRLYRDMWRIRPTGDEWGTWKMDEPNDPNYDDEDEEQVIQQTFALPREFSTSLFCATHPVHGECFVTLGLHASATKPLCSCSISLHFLRLSRNFSVRVYKVGEETLKEFEWSPK